MSTVAGTTKGLIFLGASNAILKETLQDRVVGGKREACEMTISDFDNVSFKVSVSPDTPQKIKVCMSMPQIAQLRKNGADEVLANLFPGMIISPDQGYDIGIEFDCETLRVDPSKLVKNISELKQHVFGGPLNRAFDALINKTSASLPVVPVYYRPNEAMFVCPSASKVTVIFLVDFNDQTDKAIAKIILQEFVEAQRTIRTAPPVSYSKEAPLELSSISFKQNPDSAGFISFALEDRHVQGARKEAAIMLLTGFRNYLLYHIKCSKTYLHMRMRKRVAGWMQVLNRAFPEVETEKKTVTGKTFTRK